MPLQNKDNKAFQTALTTLCSTNRAFTTLEAAYFYMNILTTIKPSHALPHALPDSPTCLHHMKLIITTILTCSFSDNKQTEPDLWPRLQEFTMDLITMTNQNDTSDSICSPTLAQVLLLANEIHAESQDTTIFPHVMHFAFFCFTTSLSVENYPVLPTPNA